MTADEAFKKIVDELSAEEGSRPDPETEAFVRRIFDAGVNWKAEEVKNGLR